MCSAVHGLRTQRKKKRFISGTTCYCRGNYSVNVSLFGLVEKELGFEKNGSKKKGLCYFRCKLVKLGKLVEFTRVYRVLTRSNSSNLPILPEIEFISKLTRFWYLKT